MKIKLLQHLVCATVICSAWQAEAYNEAKSSRNDGKSSGLTAEDQKLNELDTRITSEIRKDIVGHDGMSTNGKNITIISRNGEVTLRGEVPQNSEREWIENQANQVAGVRLVRNELRVAPNSTK